MAQPSRNMSELMCELSVALADLSEKMGDLAVILENHYLDSNATEPAALKEAAKETIEKARHG